MSSSKCERVKFSAEQRRTLEEVFTKQDTIDSTMAQRLANQLSVSVRQIRTWFQNKRAKYKRDDFKKSGRSYPILKSVRRSPVNPEVSQHPEVAPLNDLDLDLDLHYLLTPEVKVDFAYDSRSGSPNGLAAAIENPGFYLGVEHCTLSSSIASFNSASSSTTPPGLTPSITDTSSIKSTSISGSLSSFTSTPSLSSSTYFSASSFMSDCLDSSSSCCSTSTSISCPFWDLEGIETSRQETSPNYYNNGNFCSTPNLTCSDVSVSGFQSNSSTILSSSDVSTYSCNDHEPLARRDSRSSFSSVASLIVDFEATECKDRHQVMKILDFLEN